MRRTLIVGVSLALFSALASTSMAFADEENDDNDSSVYFEPDQGPVHQEEFSPITPPRVPREHHEPRETEDRHSEIEDRYKDFKGVVVPPIAIRPQSRPNPNIYELPIEGDPEDIVSETAELAQLANNPSGEFLTTQLSEDGSLKLLGPAVNKSLLNPKKHQPVEINKLVLTKQTPTDDFMQQATIVGGSLGALAVVLLTMTATDGINSKRRRKAKLFD